MYVCMYVCMSTVLHSIDSFTSLLLMCTGLPDCIWNSFQHHKQHRQNTRQTFSQPFSGSFFYYIFSFPIVLSIISSYSSSKLCTLPKLCIWGKLGTCGVIRPYNLAFSLQNVLLATAACSWDVESCTALWREAHFQVKMYKTQHSRITFWRSDVEKREAHFEVKMYKTHQLRTTFRSYDVQKLHAAVARSTFWSENDEKLRGSQHFLKLRCWKIARHCGDGLGALFEVEMLKNCTPQWQEAHFHVKNVTKLTVSEQFLKQFLKFRCRKISQ